MDAVALGMNALLFGGLFALAAGFYWKDNRCHLLRIAGMLLLMAFFSAEVVRIIHEGKDYWNITFTAVAPPLFLFVAYQEWLSYKWEEEHRSLKWLVGTAWIAAIIYYAFDRIPQFTAAIVYVVTAQSIWFGQMFGYGGQFAVGAIDWTPGHVSCAITNGPVSIILGCTGIEAIVIFVGAILATDLEVDPWSAYKDPNRPAYVRLRRMSGRERMWRALLYTTSIVWVGNLLRNVLIIYLVDVVGWDFEFVHGDLAKFFSFVILLVLAYVSFNLMPEMLDNISGIYDLLRRKSPEERAAEAAAKAQEEKEGDGGDEAEEGDEADEGDEAEEGEEADEGDEAEEGDGVEEGDEAEEGEGKEVSTEEAAGEADGPDGDDEKGTGGEASG